jgi:hypothetical protein
MLSEQLKSAYNIGRQTTPSGLGNTLSIMRSWVLDVEQTCYAKAIEFSETSGLPQSELS